MNWTVALLATFSIAAAWTFNGTRVALRNPAWRDRFADRGIKLPGYGIIGFSGLVVFAAITLNIYQAAVVVGWLCIPVCLGGYILAALLTATGLANSVRNPSGRFYLLFAATWAAAFNGLTSYFAI